MMKKATMLVQKTLTEFASGINAQTVTSGQSGIDTAIRLAADLAPHPYNKKTVNQLFNNGMRCV